MARFNPFKRAAKDGTHASDDLRRQSKLAAIDRSQAVIEFELDGTIVTANDNFLAATGYTLDEIRGRHHRIFVDADYAASDAYRAFWETLGRGEFHGGEFRRVRKDGRPVWIQATYNPILDVDGRPVRVVKYASDVTAQKERAAFFQSRIEAIDRSQAVIEFELDGTIVTANDNFLAATGYTLDEIRGRHHRIFVDADYAASDAYRAFWETLGRGEFQAGQYRRVRKDGRPVWIQASYNPILDVDGRPIRVVKYASDVTAQVEAQQALRRGIAAMLGVIDETVHAAEEISAATDQLTASAQEQSVQSREVAVSVEEMVRTIIENAQTSTRASEVATTNGQAAREGGDVVGRTIEKIRQIADVVSGTTQTVEQLGASSQQIGEIVKVIDEIADQTNLLALNAAIEAARAGEHGRGFAVVADEVRKLAERTTSATAQIADMIRTVQAETKTAVAAMQSGKQEVDEGIALADRAGTALDGIVAGSGDTVNMISQIAVASEEQSTTSEQIARSVDLISTAAADAAQGIGQIAQGVGELRRLTDELRCQVRDLDAQDASQDAPQSAPAARPARPARVSGDGHGGVPAYALSGAR